MSAHDHVSGRDIDLLALARYLESLDGAERAREIRGLGRREQARLFDAAEGLRPIGLSDIVPSGTPPLEPVVHDGRNSLPLFRLFEKRFCRPPDLGDDGRLWGYNEHAVRWATGPGYFVATEGRSGEVLLDYRELPSVRPNAWPPIKPNSSMRGRLVYGEMQDVLRGVAAGVVVGRATRRGKPLDNWFVLCRRAPGGNPSS